MGRRYHFPSDLFCIVRKRGSTSANVKGTSRKAAELFVKCLENRGVEYILVCPGSAYAHAYRESSESRPSQYVRADRQLRHPCPTSCRWTGSGSRPKIWLRGKDYRVERTHELIPTLAMALADDTVPIVECPVDYSENIKLRKKFKELSSPVLRRLRTQRYIAWGSTSSRIKRSSSRVGAAVS
jgi:hypothetical protein